MLMSVFSFLQECSIESRELITTCLDFWVDSYEQLYYFDKEKKIGFLQLVLF